MELSQIYQESLLDNKLEGVFHKHIELDTKGKMNGYKDRTLFHKIARYIYKIFRTIYVSVIFYFVPFLILLL